MMTKRLLIFVFITMLGLFSTEASLTSAKSASATSTTEKEIQLQAALPTGALLKSLRLPYRISQSSFSIDVSIMFNVGTIYVNIVDETGNLVYEKQINSQSENWFSINVSNWKEGSYTITFFHESGTSWFGDFEIIE